MSRGRHGAVGSVVAKCLILLALREEDVPGHLDFFQPLPAQIEVVKEVANLNQIRLGQGDVVLVRARQGALDAVKGSSRMLVLDDTTDLPRAHRAKRSLVALAMVIGFAALGLLPISITAIIGVGLMIALGCLSWRKVGIPLILILWLGFSIVLPLLYGI